MKPITLKQEVGRCEICQELAYLEPMVYYEEKMMLCAKCWDNECKRGDLEYEKQKEG